MTNSNTQVLKLFHSEKKNIKPVKIYYVVSFFPILSNEQKIHYRVCIKNLSSIKCHDN